MLHPPFSSWGDGGRAEGFEVDIVESAAARSGVKVEWVELPFAELLGAVESGEVDIAVSTIGITDDRKTRVAFSAPYYETQIVALVRLDSPAVNLAGLDGLVIGADRSTTSYTAAKAQWPNNEIVESATEGSTWPQMVASGVIDVFVVDASDQERLESISGIQLRRITEPISAEYFGVAMRKGAPEMMASVNHAVERLSPSVGQ